MRYNITNTRCGPGLAVEGYATGEEERMLLESHAGEIVIGFSSIVIAVVMVWLLQRQASGGIEKREEERRGQAGRRPS